MGFPEIILSLYEDVETVINAVNVDKDYGPFLLILKFIGAVTLINLFVSLFWIKRLDIEVKVKTKDILGLKLKYKNILDELPTQICEFSPDNTLTYVNKAFVDYLEASNKELLGKKFTELIPAETMKMIGGERKHFTSENPSAIYLHKSSINEKTCWVERRDRAIFDSKNNITNYYSIGIDITERKESEEKLTYLSYNDHLTKLYN